MTKKEALQIVFSCAASYKENLAGRSLLFVTTDKHKTVRCLEVSFDGSNFLHMTGFKLNKKEISANNFFSMCCDKGRFVPNTVLEGDIRSMVKGSADRIVITYRKQRGDALYTEIVYTAKKIDWTALTLPEEYQYLPLP